MNKKSLFKVLCIFALVVSLVSSFAITSSAASSALRLDEWYRFVDTPILDNDLVITNIDFEVDGENFDTISIFVNSETENVYVESISFSIEYPDGSSFWLDVYASGRWLNDDYRFIRFDFIGDSSSLKPSIALLRNMLEPVSDSPYGGLYGNVYSLIQDKIYGGYPLTGGAEITCSIVSTFLTIFVLVLPLALVWVIIKSLTSLAGRLY